MASFDPHAATSFGTKAGTGHTTLGTFGMNFGALADVPGCPECNRDVLTPWPIYTVDYHGVECCAKCLTAMHLPRRKRV